MLDERHYNSISGRDLGSHHRVEREIKLDMGDVIPVGRYYSSRNHFLYAV